MRRVGPENKITKTAVTDRNLQWGYLYGDSNTITQDIKTVYHANGGTIKCGFI